MRAPERDGEEVDPTTVVSSAWPAVRTTNRSPGPWSVLICGRWSALFSRRVAGYRPKVIPDGSQNFAFLGQFTELAGDVVFTVEYPIHGAMRAVYRFLGVERPIPPMHQGLRDPHSRPP